MSETSADVKQTRMKEFMQLLPLTLEIAGLPKCHPDRAFTPDQMDARITTIRIAYKLSRNLLREVADAGN